MSKDSRIYRTRLGYTVIPKALERSGMHLNEMWMRNRTTKTNGVSYIIQKGGAAVFTEEGQKQIRERIQVYKKNAKVLMEVLDSWESGIVEEKCSLYLDEMPQGNGKLGVFRLPAPGDPGSGNAGRRLDLRRRVFPVLDLWFAGGYERGGRTAVQGCWSNRKRITSSQQEGAAGL